MYRISNYYRSSWLLWQRQFAEALRHLTFSHVIHSRVVKIGKLRLECNKLKTVIFPTSAYFLFIIIRIITHIPSGQARTAARLRAPLTIVPRDTPKSEIAATRRSGPPQHIAIPSGPLSQPLFSIEQP